MSYLARKLRVKGEIDDYVVGLWVGSEGCRISVTVDECGDGDVFGEDVSHVPIDDMLVIGRKVRRLAKWAESEKGRAKVAALFEKDANLLAGMQERAPGPPTEEPKR